MKKSLPLLLLSVIPAGLFIFGTFMIRCIYKYYINWPDPTYAYLFNGLNLASGKLAIGHVDHPGTPLQCFTALMIRTINLFRGNTPVIKDVLANPEIYLAPICYSISALVGLTTFFVGYSIYKKSRQLWAGLFFQFIPLATFEVVFLSANLMTEPMLVAGTMLLLVIVYHYVCLESAAGPGIKYPLGFGLFIGFILAVKISSLPLLLLPFILLSGGKNKLIFLFSTLLFFLLFIAPAFNEFTRFTDFIIGIWHHTGTYGKGQEGLVDRITFKHNLVLIFTGEWTFTTAYIVLLISSVILLYRNGLRKSISNRTFRMLAGSWTAMTLQILIVAKHYSSHYLFPAYCLIVPGLYFSISALTIFPFLWRIHPTGKWREIALILLALVLFSRDFIRADFIPFEKTPDGATFQALQKYPNAAKIILTGNSSAPCPEPALAFGLAYSGSQKQDYALALKKLYPDSYFFSASGNYFYSWQEGQEFLLKDMLCRNRQLIVYVCKKDKVSEKMVMDKIKVIGLKTGSVSVTKVIMNNENGDCIYEITTDSKKLDYHLHLEKDILCTMETYTHQGTAFQSNASFTLKGVASVSEEKSFSGKKSVKLTSANEFSLQTMLPASPGHFYEISIWKQSMKNNLALVATSKNGSFYKSGTTSADKKGDWDQIKISFELPLNFKEDSIQVYVWNVKNTRVYLDDLSIQEYKIETGINVNNAVK